MVFPRPVPGPHPARPHPHAERVVPGAEPAAQFRRLRGQHRLQPRAARRRRRADGDGRATTSRPTATGCASVGGPRARARGRRRVHRAGLHHHRPRRQPDHRLPPGCDEPGAPEPRAGGRGHHARRRGARTAATACCSTRAQFAAAGIPLLFDPGQGLPMFDGAELLDFIDKATWVAVNDYEGQLLRSAPGLSLAEMAARVRALIVTSGAEGSVIHADGREIRDPDGAARGRRGPDRLRRRLSRGADLRPAEWPRLGDHGPHRVADGRDQDRPRRHPEPPLHARRVRATASTRHSAGAL